MNILIAYLMYRQPFKSSIVPILSYSMCVICSLDIDFHSDYSYRSQNLLMSLLFSYLALIACELSIAIHSQFLQIPRM